LKKKNKLNYKRPNNKIKTLKILLKKALMKITKIFYLINLSLKKNLLFLNTKFSILNFIK
jgi:hypothetical protein